MLLRINSQKLLVTHFLEYIKEGGYQIVAITNQH